MKFHHWKEVGLFAGGLAAGILGAKVLSSQGAKKVYVKTTATALRAKDCVMGAVNKVQENAEDVLAEAKAVNEERAEKAAAAEAENVVDETTLCAEPKAE